MTTAITFPVSNVTAYIIVLSKWTRYYDEHFTVTLPHAFTDRSDAERMAVELEQRVEDGETLTLEDPHLPEGCVRRFSIDGFAGETQRLFFGTEVREITLG